MILCINWNTQQRIRMLDWSPVKSTSYSRKKRFSSSKLCRKGASEEIKAETGDYCWFLKPQWIWRCCSTLSSYVSSSFRSLVNQYSLVLSLIVEIKMSGVNRCLIQCLTSAAHRILSDTVTWDRCHPGLSALAEGPCNCMKHMHVPCKFTCLCR